MQCAMSCACGAKIQTLVCYVMSCIVMLMLCLLIYLNKTQVNLIHMSAVFPVTAVYSLILTDVKTFLVLIVKNNQIVML